MNNNKIALAKKIFFEVYPDGFSDEKMSDIKKRHNIGKLTNFANEIFIKDNFDNTDFILDSWVKLNSRSSMVSLFEKPKFRDSVKIMSETERSVLVKGLYEYLYGDRENGFNLVLDILSQYKIAKWTLVTALPYYLKPEEEVFIKPTTVKKAIEFFEFDCIKYKPKPSLEFYENYKSELLKLKEIVGLTKDNAALGGFIMVATGL